MVFGLFVILTFGGFLYALRSYSSSGGANAPSAEALYVDEVVTEIGALRHAIGRCGAGPSPGQVQRIQSLRIRVDEATAAFAAGQPAISRRIRDAEAAAAFDRADLAQARCSAATLLGLEEDMAEVEAALRTAP